MSRYNPKVFTNVDSLGEIKIELISQFLTRFPDFCEEQGLNLRDGEVRYEAIR